ncbi:MAG: hypothetical protein HKN03_02865 [Acidimicrobiales bacterium]|nr:hypothetical protein [Acidimicrobiales bacterium]
MKLQIGQAVKTTDGDFGEVHDIVVDAANRTVTHLVVEPYEQHFQARLVPLWLIRAENGSLVIDLDSAHARQLQRVAQTDFIRLGEWPELDGEWEIGVSDVVSLPYFNFNGDVITEWFDGHATVHFDRIPKGECEIRRESTVRADDGEPLGCVEGFLVDGDDLAGVIVRSGLPGFRRFRLVPMGKVADVANDWVRLTLISEEFARLPEPEGLTGPGGAALTDDIAQWSLEAVRNVRHNTATSLRRAVRFAKKGLP